MTKNNKTNIVVDTNFNNVTVAYIIQLSCKLAAMTIVVDVMMRNATVTEVLNVQQNKWKNL